MDKAEKKLYGEHLGNQFQYYYIVAVCDGKKCVLGPYATEEKANKVGFSKLDSFFDIIPLCTRDRGRAVQQLRARDLNSGSTLSQALQRTSHKL